MTPIGYARVSSTDQSLDIQLEKLRAAGCKRIFQEKRSGKDAASRPELQAALEFLTEGDTLVVSKLDRLARSLRDLQNIVHDLRGKGAHLKVLDQQVDTNTPGGKAMFGMLGVFAEFERDLIAERRTEGIAKAKAEGKYRGRKRGVCLTEVQDSLAQGMGVSAIARKLKVTRMSIYRAMDTLGVNGPKSRTSNMTPG